MSHKPCRRSDDRREFGDERSLSSIAEVGEVTLNKPLMVLLSNGLSVTCSRPSASPVNVITTRIGRKVASTLLIKAVYEVSGVLVSYDAYEHSCSGVMCTVV